ncbi:MAG: PKD domain-containing protein [Phycisphaerae bacterium]|nr:PKD domain-containing protein [Phycisphaerae bacterium]
MGKALPTAAGLSPADFDNDGDVDLDDLLHFTTCLSGAGLPPSDPACSDADLDHDSDVDLDDFGLFQIMLSGPGPTAEAGGPYRVVESAVQDVLGGLWPVTLDGRGSHAGDPGDPIVSYLWEGHLFRKETFDGATLDTARWNAANAVQNDNVTVTGQNGWGPSYVFTQEPLDRAEGIKIQARVTCPSLCHAMWGIKHNVASTSYTAMPYAIYFRDNGYLHIYEDGSDRGHVGYYSAGTTYEVRIDVKPVTGASYYIRPPGCAEWLPLYDSTYGGASGFVAGLTVHSASVSMDDLFHPTKSMAGDVAECWIAAAGEAKLTVTNVTGQTGTDTASIGIDGQVPTAVCGGPYHGPLGAIVAFDALNSVDDVAITHYAWDFGDGGTATGRYVKHAFAAAGTYNVTLTVRDHAGQTGTAATTATIEAMAVCVPWEYDRRSGREVPHSVWDGLQTRVKAVLFTDTAANQLTYSWDFGDGDAPATGTVSDKRALETSHTYRGPAGALYTATLTVHDPQHGDLVDTYPVEIHARDLTIEVNAAIDEGLWWLHKNQTIGGTGSVDYYWRSYGGYWMGSTASTLHAMEINGHVPTRSAGQDPYAEDVSRALDTMFTGLTRYWIGPQTYGDPDSNANTVGLSVNSDRPIYEGGMVMDAIAASGAPDLMACRGDAFALGRTYREIAREMADQYAWGQTDRGGWRYSWNSDDDNSACQWAAIGFMGTKTAFGLDAPSWVKDRNDLWLTQSYNGTGFGYTGAGNGEATTPSGMVQLAFCGKTIEDNRWKTAEAWIANNWEWWKKTNNVYAWYAFAKAMRLAQPQPVTQLTATGMDWYDHLTAGLTKYILNRQQTDGGWPDYYGRVFASAWQVTILTPTLFTRPPVAMAGDDVVWAFDRPLTLDGSLSYHTDPVRLLVQYEWDFDGDGAYEYVGVEPTVQHIYAFDPAIVYPTVYSARLRVTDDIGQTDTDVRQVTIAEPPHPPMAVIGGPYQATAGVPFQPDASDSYDIDPGDFITRQEWDFNGSDGYDFEDPDAAVDCPAARACPQVSWTFDTPGVYNIGLRVWDNAVLHAELAKLASVPVYTTVTVSGNIAPIAHAGGPYDTVECQPLQLDGTASSDANGDAITYAWDLDGDGEYDDATGPAPSHTWDTAGVYSVGLIVSDGSLSSQAVQVQVTVGDSTPQVTVIGPDKLAAGQLGLFDALVTSACEVQAVEWDWDFDSTEFNSSGDAGAAQEHVYASQGTYMVAVRVTDKNGAASIGTTAVQISAADSPRVYANTRMKVIVGRRDYDVARHVHMAQFTLLNQSTVPMTGPIGLAFSDINPSSVVLLNASGTVPHPSEPERQIAYVDFSSLLTNNTLAAGASIGPKWVEFQGPQDVAFTFDAFAYLFNSPPRITSAPVVTATEGQRYRYEVVAVDDDGDPVRFGLTATGGIAPPAGMSVHPLCGLVDWMPGQQAAGAQPVTIVVDDGLPGSSAQQAFEITVSAVNVAPTITSTPITTAIVNAAYTYQVQASDPDGDPISYALTEAPTDMTLSSSGLVQWAPMAPGGRQIRLTVTDDHGRVTGQDYVLTAVGCEAPPRITSEPLLAAAEGQPYTYQVVVDGAVTAFSLAAAPAGMTISPSGLISWTPAYNAAGARTVKVIVATATPDCQAEQIFQIEVDSRNGAPSFITVPVTAATEGVYYRYGAQATDPDGETVGYTLIQGPEGMKINPVAGVIEWIPSQTAAAGSPHTVIITATDPLRARTVQTFQIQVAAQEMPPRIVSEPIYGAVEGTLYEYQVVAEDPDDDQLAYALPRAPTGMTISATGLIQWTPPQDAAAHNPQIVEISVTDPAGHLASQVYQIFVRVVNVPPEITSEPATAGVEGQVYRYSVVATDADLDVLTYSLVTTPGGMSIHPGTGLIDWLVPQTAAAANPHSVTVAVSDGIETVQQSFEITVAEVNVGPIITSTPEDRATVDEPYTYGVVGSDPDGDPVVFSLLEGPEDMTIDPVSGTVQWTPVEGDFGNHAVTIRVDDDHGHFVTQVYTLFVSELGHDTLPQITSTPIFSAQVDQQYRYQVIAEDLDGDPLFYALLLAPPGMAVDTNAGLITWTPTAAQIGSHEVHVKVDDRRIGYAVQTYFVTVSLHGDNSPPRITSTPPFTARVDERYVYPVAATDPDNDSLRFTLVKAPVGAGIDSASGQLTWTPNAEQVGRYDVTIRVDDGRGGWGEQQYSLTVSLTGENRSPDITSTPALAAGVDQAYAYQVVAIDPDLDPLVYVLETKPSGMTIGATTGLIGWTPGVADLGVHEVSVKAADGKGGWAIQTYALTVSQAGGNTSPRFISVPVTVAQAEATYSYSAKAVDDDGDAITYGLATAPDGMVVVAASGLIEWTPQATQLGTHPVVLRADDGRGGYTQQSFQVTVSADGTNRAPRIVSTAITTVMAGQNYQYVVVASDEDGDALSFALEAAPAAMTIDAATGAIGWATTAEDVGRHPVTITVTDSDGAWTTQPYELEVRVNQPPRIVSSPSTRAVVDMPYRYEVKATDPEMSRLGFALDQPVEGMAIDAQTGVITWTPTAAQVGPHAVVVVVRDSLDAEARQNYTLTVYTGADADLYAPEVTVTAAPRTVNPGEPVTLTVKATDDLMVTALALTVNDAPIALTADGQAVFTPTVPGGFVARATATDLAGHVGKGTTDFYARTPGDSTAPTVAITAPAADAALKASTAIVGTASDDNLYKYTLAYRSVGTEAYIEFATSYTSVVGGTLGTLDTTLMMNGMYEVRLRAEDTNGNVNEVTTGYSVAGNLKLGNFSISFVDLAIPVSGIPIRLTRTYDSRNKAKGDFGVGWTLDIASLQIKKNKPAGKDWEQRVIRGLGGLNRFILIPKRTHIVSITWPGGRTEQFAMRTVPAEQAFIPIEYFSSVVFDPIPPATSKLQVLGDTSGYYTGGPPADASTPSEGDLFFYSNDLFDPSSYRLTTREGRSYTLVGLPGSPTANLQAIKDGNDNSLEITHNGILHSSGKGVIFERDGEDRLVSMTDPKGGKLRFEYDDRGDLISFVNQAGNTTRFVYNDDHYLVEIIDPRGVTASRLIYDDAGHLVASIDANGKRVDLQHNLDTRQEVVRDENGTTWVYDYDAAGNVVAETDGLGRRSEYTYDGQGHLLTEKDALNNVTTYTYSTSGDLLTSTSPVGAVVRMAYNDHGRVTSVTDPNGNTQTSAYDDRGNLVSVTDVTGNTTTFSYDARGHLLTKSDPLGNVTSYQYDSFGNQTEVQKPDGTQVSTTYDENGNALSQTYRTASGGSTIELVTMNQYDAMNRVVRTVDPYGEATEVTYDEAGLQTLNKDARGRETRFEYNLSGRMVRRVNPDGTAYSASYDATGRPLSSSDWEGNTVSYEYNAVGLQTRMRKSNGCTIERTYDALGRILTETDCSGTVVAQYEYDAAGRLIGSTDAFGKKATLTYDAGGNPLQMKDPLGRVIGIEYTSRNEVAAVHYPDGTSTTMKYDTLGRRTQETDALGRVTRYEYDNVGRLTKVGDALGNETTFGYNGMGRRTWLRDALGHETTWEYDNRGRLLRTTRPDGSTETFAYSPDNRLTSSTNGDGETVEYVYDTEDRLAAKLLPDGNRIEYQYDLNGRRTQVSYMGRVFRYAYDASGRLSQVTDAHGRTVTYTYNVNGRRQSMTTPAGTVQYAYDAAGQLTTITDPDGATTLLAYDDLGRRTSCTLPNGVRTTYTYDQGDYLLSSESRKADDSLLASFRYEVNAAGHRTKAVETTPQGNRELTFRYDELYRLTDVDTADSVRGPSTEAYGYDAVGNRLTKLTLGAPAIAYAYDADDHLTQAGSTRFAWDRKGNRVARFAPSDTATFEYDRAGRMVAVQRTSPQIERLTYSYDDDGIMTAFGVNGAMSQYVIDKAAPLPSPIEEYDASSNLAAYYVYDDTGILYFKRGGQSFYCVKDGFGSVRLLTDATGQVTDLYTYDTFGNVADRQGSTLNRHFFRGQVLDAKTDLYYLRARHYDPVTGLFTTRDRVPGDSPVPRSLHRYSYCMGNPVTYADPLGNKSLIEQMGVCAIIANLVGMFVGTTSAMGILGMTTVYVEDAMASGSPLPTHILVGLAGNYNFGTTLAKKWPRYFAGWYWLTGVGSVEGLIGTTLGGGPKTSCFWLYGSLGLAVNALYDPGAGFTPFAGLVWNATQTGSYEGPFFTTSGAVAECLFDRKYDNMKIRKMVKKLGGKYAQRGFAIFAGPKAMDDWSHGGCWGVSTSKWGSKSSRMGQFTLATTFYAYLPDLARKVGKGLSGVFDSLETALDSTDAMLEDLEEALEQAVNGSDEDSTGA